MGYHGRRKSPHDPGRSGPPPWSVPRATDDKFDELLVWLREKGIEGYLPALGLSGSLTATVMYMRQNIVQAVIGEFLGVSQPTVSRAIKALTEAIARTPEVLLLTAEDVPEDCDYVVNGTLSPAGTGATAAICGRASTGVQA